MSEEALFSVGPQPSTSALQVNAPISDWQRDLIVKALDARGVTAMDKRQQLVEAAAGRSLSSLRDLSHDEAIAVLNRLGRGRPTTVSASSLWESRDEDTWIDRL